MSNWIKWCKGLAKKREILLLASRFKRDEHEIAGRLMALWEWCDENMDDCHFVGEDAIMSLGNRARVIAFIDRVTGIKGMSLALESPDIDWLQIGDGSQVVFKKLRRHNGKTAKERATEQRKKSDQRAGSSVPEIVPVAPGQKQGLDERKTRGDQSFLSSNGKTIGSASNHSPPSGRSSKEVRDEIDQRPKADLRDLDWSHAVALAEGAARYVPPLTKLDRRAWLRFAAMACTACSEEWLAGTADAVSRSTNVQKTRQAMFVAALKKKAFEQWGIDEPNFQAMVRSIEIPTDVWKSAALEVGK